ncbi:MAG: hypothetical protein M0R80_30510 [Proteobacteria bacterium]|jgi:hypothetical protein|nr:hypothetical protein [Pseudomonadota bacterium]
MTTSVVEGQDLICPKITLPSEVRAALRKTRPFSSRSKRLNKYLEHPDHFAFELLWTRPNPALTNPFEIVNGYGITFAGYEYARAMFGDHHAAFDVAQPVFERKKRTGQWEGTFLELRFALFCTQRAIRFQDNGLWDPDGEEIADLCALNAAICEAWRRETASVPS